MTVQEALEQRKQNMQQAEEIRQQAKTAGTWGKSREVVQNIQSRGKTNAEKLNVQKKKEDAAEEKADINSAQIKKDRTKKEYDDYVASEEYKQKKYENEKKAAEEAAAHMILNPGGPMPTPQIIQDEKEQMLRAARDQAEAEYNAAEDEKVIVSDLEAITGLSDAERKQLEQYFVGRDIDFYEGMSAASRGDFSTPYLGRAEQEAAALIEKYGFKRVQEMANTLERIRNAEMTQSVAELGQQHANSGFLGGTAASAATVPVGILSGPAGIFERAKEMTRKDNRFKTLDPNSMGNLGNVYSASVRGQVGENIQDTLGDGFVGKAASIGYQGVMSAADSVARAYMGGGAFGGATLAATNTFSQTMADASRQGATPGQAALLATVNSGIEALSEKIPLDNLIRTAKGAGAKTVIANALRQMGIEATTEEISLLGTVLAEAGILQEKSSYNREVTTAILAGLSPDEAIKQANKSIIDEAVNTALVSMVSGGASSLGGSYADARGLFVETQEQTNPELNRSKNAQEAAQKAIENNRARRAAMEAEEAAQQPKTAAPAAEPAVQPQQQAETQTAPQQAPQAQQPAEQPSISDVVADVITRMRESNGKASNRMAETVMADPTAMQELGVNPEGTKAEQRRRVKEEMEKLFQTQEQSETVQDVAEAQPMQAIETSEQATMQASAPTANMQMGASNQSAESGQIKGTGAAERNFSGVADYEDMLSDNNVQRQLPNAARDVEMPKVDSDGRRVTEFAKNVADAEVTPEPLADAVKSLVGDKKLSFDTRSNQESLNNAAEAIRTQGDTAVIADIHAHAEAKTVKDGDIEKGLVLYAQYANDPDPKSQETAAQIIVDMAALANMSGRNLQLFSLMQRMTPEGRIKVLKKDLARSIKQINAGRSKNKQVDLSKPDVMTDKKATENDAASKKVLGDDVDVHINEELAQKFLDAKTDKEKEAVMDEIYKDVASRIKPTLGEVWDAWRNLAMLGNFKTHERNILSTAAYQPYQSVKRGIGTVLEKVLRIDPEQRTKSVLGVGKKSQDLLKWAKTDARTNEARNLMQRSGTTGNEGRSVIQEYRKILPGILDKASKKNMELMENADMRFKQREYALSLASFLKARGYTTADIKNGNVPNGVLDEGRQIAVREAMKATFNDSNKLSDAMVKYGKANERDGNKVLNIVKKGTMPFLRTPANVVARAVENNPLTMVANLATARKDIESGRKSAADVLDGLSANLAGGVGVALGALLGSGAFEKVELIGSIEDEEELREGAQEYSVRIGDKYYNVAWLAPAMIPLFLGANLARNNYFAGFQDADGWDIAKAVVDLGADTLEPILELSMLSSLNDAVKKFTSEEDPGDGAMAVFLNSLTSYVQQGLPTIIGQAEQATETEKSSTFVNTGNKLEEIVKSAVSNATKRIPGKDLYQTKKLDEWGNVVQNDGDAFDRIVNSFFNPSTVTTRKTDAVTQEITRLNRAGENVSPDTAPKTVSYIDKDGNGHDDVRLTEEQYQTYAEVQGQEARKLVDTMISSKDYQAMTDKQKADAINAAYQYARMKAEITAVDDHAGYDQGWMYDVDKGGAAEILRRTLNSGINTAMSDLDNAWEKGYNPEAFAREMENMFNSYKNASAATKRQVYAEATGTAKKYIEIRDKGISHEDSLAAIKSVATVKGTGAVNKDTGAKTVRDIDRRAAIANTPGLSEAERDLIMKAYMADYDPSEESPETTEFKYQYAREELGLSAKEYAETYRAYLDNSKKAQKINAIMDQGYDRKTANALYKLYAGRLKDDLINMYG